MRHNGNRHLFDEIGKAAVKYRSNDNLSRATPAMIDKWAPHSIESAVALLPLLLRNVTPVYDYIDQPDCSNILNWKTAFSLDDCNKAREELFQLLDDYLALSHDAMQHFQRSIYHALIKAAYDIYIYSDCIDGGFEGDLCNWDPVLWQTMPICAQLFAGQCLLKSFVSTGEFSFGKMSGFPASAQYVAFPVSTYAQEGFPCELQFDDAQGIYYIPVLAVEVSDSGSKVFQPSCLSVTSTGEQNVGPCVAAYMYFFGQQDSVNPTEFKNMCGINVGQWIDKYLHWVGSADV